MAELVPLSMLFLPLLVIVPVLYFIRSSRRHEGSHRPRPPPSPWALPVIGHLHHVAGALPHRAMLDLSRRHGPLMLLRLCELRVVVASSAEAAREIMKTQDLAFASRPMTPTGTALLGDSPGIVFAPYGDAWRQLRKICTLELFTSRRVRSFRPVREEEVGRLFRSVAPSPSLAVNLSERISAYVADSAVRAVIGSRFKDRGAFLRMLERRMKLAPAQCLPDLFPSSRLAMLVSRMPREMKRERLEMREFVDAIIQEHQENSMAGAAADDDEDFLDVLLRIQREGKLDPPLTNDDIKAVIVDIFIASSETSATALQWAMAELMRNPRPRVMRKAQEEVRRVLDGHDRVTEESLANVRYLDLVIKEVLRLHPPATMLAAPPRVPGPVPGPPLRRAGGRDGARQRVGDRQGPEALGRAGGVLAGEVRGWRRRLQGHGLRVHTVRRRAADVPRHGVRAGQHGARARQPSLPLRLGAAGRDGGRGAGHGRAAGAHHAAALQPLARPGGARAIANGNFAFAKGKIF